MRPLLLTVTFGFLLAGCDTAQGDASPEDELLNPANDEVASTSDSLSGNVTLGATLQTTANLNLRSGAGTDSTVRLVIPKGGNVTVVNTGAPSHGFYNVKYNGTVGWSSGAYLKLVTSTSNPTAGIHDGTREGAIARAKSAVGGTYWWGHGRWFPNGQGGSNAGSCSGSCPNCTHSGGTGADCSGYVAKLWEVPSSNDDLTVDSHPYSTATFVNDSSMWHTVSRDSVLQSDALVYNSNGAGHIFLFDSGDAWGWMNVYEAKGCAYGIVHDLRTATSAYHAIRRY